MTHHNTHHQKKNAHTANKPAKSNESQKPAHETGKSQGYGDRKRKQGN
ncbi:hypothetical protein [Legionella israelensis]|nr:hypothetical protein [Legionella israelensis]